MRVFQDLTISGSSDGLQKLRLELLQSADGWRPFVRNDEWMMNDESKKDGSFGSEAGHFIALDTPRSSRLRSATIFVQLKNEGQTACVGNIFPDSDSLSQEEYNAILKGFYVDCIQPRMESCHLKCVFSAEFVNLEDTLSQSNQSLLREFVHMANKSTGASHPYDYDRWMTFVGASVRDEEHLRTDLLTEWLTEQGFPHYIASDLVQQYKFGFDLIKKLERDAPHKAEQDAVHADR